MKTIDHSIDIRYEKNVVRAFNKFIQKWCGDSFPHLIDNDENDGEFMRKKIQSLIPKPKKPLLCYLCEAKSTKPHDNMCERSKTPTWKQAFIKELCNDHDKLEGPRLLRGIFVEDILEFIENTLRKTRKDLLDEVELELRKRRFEDTLRNQGFTLYLDRWLDFRKKSLDKQSL